MQHIYNRPQETLTFPCSKLSNAYNHQKSKNLDEKLSLANLKPLAMLEPE